jgi:hypothetical protein
LKRVVGVGSRKIKVNCNFPPVLKVKWAKFHQSWGKTVDLHTKQTNQPTTIQFYIQSVTEISTLILTGNKTHQEQQLF